MVQLNIIQLYIDWLRSVVCILSIYGLYLCRPYIVLWRLSLESYN